MAKAGIKGKPLKTGNISAKVAITVFYKKVKPMIITGKIVTLLGWALIIFNCISPINGFSDIVNWSGAGLLAAHCVETLVFLPKAKKLGGNLAAHIAQLLVFGYVHNMEMDKLLAEKH